jgi:hypothetical protein
MTSVRRSRRKTARPGTLTRASVQNVVRNTLGDWVVDDQLRFIAVVSDEVYQGADLAWLMGMIVNDPVLAPGAYRQDVFDCDDYAFYVKTRASLYAENRGLTAPLAVGVLLTDAHAFNICVSGEGALTIVNTQSDDRATASTPAAFGEFLSLGPANRIRLIYL